MAKKSTDELENILGQTSTSNIEDYLAENTTLLISGKLHSHLAEIDNRTTEMLDRLVKQLAEKEGITERLKAADQMAWVGAMNNIRNRAEEIVNTEVIYA